MNKRRSDCAISCSLEIFGDKWSLLIIRDIMFRGKISYSEFLDSEEKIATNILSNRLNLLEAHDILIKEVSPTNKSKFVYSLTQKGVDLLPIIIEIIDWGVKYNTIFSPGPITQKVMQDKAAVIQEYTQKLKEQSK